MSSIPARPRGRLRLVVSVLLVLGAPCSMPTSEARSPDDRETTCLVLSGGGARGTAHVGVLRVLEARGAVFDCIVGTSMGAIVGGLYASGVTVDELEERFEATDWRDLFSDRPARRDIPFRRKQDDDLPLFRFEFGVDASGLELPGALIAGQKLDFLLESMSLHTTGVRDFDDFPVRFRAIATDLETGERVVLGEGRLPEALRASMAVPGVFAPVEIGGRTLVDGGLTSNLPILAARELGASRILAVDLAASLDDEELDDSVVSVASRTITVLTEQNVERERRHLGPRDLLIEIDTGDIDATSFERVPETIEIGAEAATARRAAIDRFARPSEVLESDRARREAFRSRTSGLPVIDEVRIEGVDRVDPRIVRRRVRTVPGERLDLDVLRGDLQRIYRLGDFEIVDLALDTEGSPRERATLRIDAREKSWGPNFLRFGLSLRSDFEGRGEFAVLADLTRTRINALGAELKGRLTVGERNALFGEWYQPLDFGGRWFVAPQVELSRDRFDVRVDDTFGEIRADRATGQLDVGSQFRAYGELRVGLRRGIIDVEDEAGILSTVDGRVDVAAVVGQLTIDRLDNANFPRDGTLLAIESVSSRVSLGADRTYDRVAGFFATTESVGRQTYAFLLELGHNLGSELPVYDRFSLGGFLNLSGFRPGELSGEVLGLAQVVSYRQIARLPGILGGGVYVGASVELGNVWPELAVAELSDTIAAGSVFTGVDTIFGPIYLSAGFAEGGERAFYLSVGQAF